MIHFRTDNEIELLRQAALLVGMTLGEVGKHIFKSSANSPLRGSRSDLDSKLRDTSASALSMTTIMPACRSASKGTPTAASSAAPREAPSTW